MSSRLEELFFKLRLPKNREDQDILEFLKCERTYLVNELTSITNNMSDSFRHELYEKLKNTIPLVEKQFNLVFNIITNYEINKNLSMQYLEQLINNIDNFFYKKYLIQNSFECFTRIRYGEEFALTRSELFHPPFPKSIDYGRYSTPNIHTLYLTNNINLAWYECDLPNVFAYTEIIPADTLTIFRLNLCPYKEVFSQLICYQNRYKNTDNLDKIEQDICNYLAFYPLFISCSLSVSKKDCDTYPKEYFISNLLIEWIQKSETIDGISYYPCSFYSIGREYGINYAFPTKTNTKKYCAIKNKY